MNTNISYAANNISEINLITISIIYYYNNILIIIIIVI